MDDRLYRSVDDRMLAGVAGGVAERLDADPSIIRIVWALMVFLSGGIALIVYLVMAIVVPDDPGTDPAGAARPPSGPAPWPAAQATPPIETTSGDPAPGTAETTAGVAGGVAAAASGLGAVALDADAPTVATPTRPGSPTQPEPGSPPAPGTTGSWVAPDGRTVSRAQARRDARRERRAARDERGPLLGGLILILIGGFFLIRQFIPAIDLGAWWPVLLVGIGVLLVIVSVTPGRRSD